MIQFREISTKESLEMIANNQLNNLYFKTKGGQIDCVKGYNINFDDITKRQYFKKEEIK